MHSIVYDGLICSAAQLTCKTGQDSAAVVKEHCLLSAAVRVTVGIIIHPRNDVCCAVAWGQHTSDTWPPCLAAGVASNDTVLTDSFLVCCLSAGEYAQIACHLTSIRGQAVVHKQHNI